jgi:hypothetical protein
VVAACLAATVAHYLGALEPGQFPESPALCRGARVMAWLLLFCAAAIGIAWRAIATGPDWMAARATLRTMHWAMFAFNAAICFGLLKLKRPEDETLRRFPLDIGVFSVLGSRNNILASVLDSAERPINHAQGQWPGIILFRRNGKVRFDYAE